MELRLSEREQRQLQLAVETLLSPPTEASDIQWQMDVVAVIAGLTRANTGAIRTSEGHAAHMTTVGVDPSLIRPYVDYYQKFDYGRALGGPQAKGQLFSRNDYWGEDLPAFRRSEYYTDYLSKHNFLDAMCLSTRTELHDRGTVLYLWYDKELTSFNRARVVAVLGLIAPIFQAGMASRGDLYRRHGELFANIDQYTDGCAVFSSSGKPLHRNPALCVMLASCSDQQPVIEEIQRQVTEVSAVAVGRHRSGVSIPRASADYSLDAFTYRISASILDSVHSGPQPLILVCVARIGNETRAPRAENMLRDHFGLTSRETEVAILLHQRLTNREIAHQLGLSEHTARHHTERIMLKLGVTARADIRKRILEAIAAQTNY